MSKLESKTGEKGVRDLGCHLARKIKSYEKFRNDSPEMVSRLFGANWF